jgi:hypothetical protein
MPEARIFMSDKEPEDYSGIPPMSIQRLKKATDFCAVYDLDRAVDLYFARLRDGIFI